MMKVVVVIIIVMVVVVIRVKLGVHTHLSTDTIVLQCFGFFVDIFKLQVKTTHLPIQGTMVMSPDRR